MAIIKFTGNYNTSTDPTLVFAGLSETVNVQPGETWHLYLEVNWGVDGQVVKYTTDTSWHASETGVYLDNDRLILTMTDNDSSTLRKYTSSGVKTITVIGGWKKKGVDSVSVYDNTYLSLPKQPVQRFTDNKYLNNKKGDINLTAGNEKYALADPGELFFQFDGDFVGLQSSDEIYLTTWRSYSIPEKYNFRLDDETSQELEVTYENGLLKTKGKTGYIKYLYDVDSVGVGLSGEFKITNGILPTGGPTGPNWQHMYTQRHKIDSSEYEPFNGKFIHNKTRFWKIEVGEGFLFHGVGDFAGYERLGRLSNIWNATHVFPENNNHVFLGCKSLRYSDVATGRAGFGAEWSECKGLVGHFSGCVNFLDFWRLPLDGAPNATDFTGIFEYSNFRSGIVNGWNMTNAKTVESMFEGCVGFNKSLAKWGQGITPSTALITNYKNMFKNCYSFNQWSPRLVWLYAKDVESMFQNARSFNTNPNSWETNSVKTFKNMFKGAASFEKAWKPKTGAAYSMEGMFEGTKFNHSVWSNGDYWNISRVTSLKNMFKNTPFNMPVKSWDVGLVQNMEGVFDGCTSFNQNLNDWEIGNVKTFKNMFRGATDFNNGATATTPVATSSKPVGWQPMWKWANKLHATEVSMEGMFENSNFNQKISNWSVGGVTSIKNMFKNNTAFRMELFPGWKLKQSTLTDMTGFLDGANVDDAVLKANTFKQRFIKGFALMFGRDVDDVSTSNKSSEFNTARASWEEDNLSPTGTWKSDYKLDESGVLTVVTADPAVSTSFRITVESGYGQAGMGYLGGQWSRVLLERTVEFMGEPSKEYTYIWINNSDPSVANEFISIQDNINWKSVLWTNDLNSEIEVTLIANSLYYSPYDNMKQAFADWMGDQNETAWIEDSPSGDYFTLYGMNQTFTWSNIVQNLSAADGFTGPDSVKIYDVNDQLIKTWSK